MSGLVHVYCGDGKGKTTAAIGLSVRASGCGMRVLFTQFLKGRDTGELHAFAEMPRVTVLRGDPGEKFSFQMDERERQRAYDENTRTLLTALERMRAGEFELVVLDEVFGAISCGLLDEDLCQSLLRQKPDATELVLTGRNPPEWALARADYITEMVKRRHPYDSGIVARKGIER